MITQEKRVLKISPTILDRLKKNINKLPETLSLFEENMLLGRLLEREYPNRKEFFAKRSLAPGEVLFLEGDKLDTSSSMFIIRSGLIAIVKGTLSSPILLGIRAGGESVGEMGVLEELPRSASAIALEDTALIEINRSNFLGLLNESPSFSHEVMRLLSARLREASSDVERLVVSRTEEITSAYEATLEGWASALELREKETAGHSRRVVERTLKIAKRIGVPEEQLVHIRRGALLHDIGKMGVPDTILLKPGPLTDEEQDLMRQHPVYAYELLSKITFLVPALEIPYYHHEKWDGSGYPLGLAGEEIPLAARIFAIVDVWDALTSDRAYRKALPKDEVIAYIKTESGTHFDPDLVQVFLDLI